MKANGPRHPQLPARGSVWPWILTLGCLLLILIAVLLPRQKAGRSDRAEPARPPGPTAPGQADSGPSGSRPFARAGAGPAPTAQEIVAGKVSQFARIRLGTVQAMARHFKLEVPDEVKRFFAAVEAGRLDEADALFKSMSERRKGSDSPPGLRELWPAVLETYGITEQTRAWPAQKLLDYGNAVLDSLRPGMIYVGGTDEGRFIPTLLNETSEGEHHTILTQNALADRTYLEPLTPDVAERIRFHIPDETEKRHGQAIAAASLPTIRVQEKTHAVS